MSGGNDAAITLGLEFGQFLKESELETRKNRESKEEEPVKLVKPLDFFTREMNKYSRALRLTFSSFTNPEGSFSHTQKTTASDMGRLFSMLMHDPLFREIS